METPLSNFLCYIHWSVNIRNHFHVFNCLTNINSVYSLHLLKCQFKQYHEKFFYKKVKRNIKFKTYGKLLMIFIC